MKRYLLFFILAAMLVSCGHKKDNASQSTSILNKKEMAAVLVDVYLAEAELMTSMQEGKNTKEYTNLYYNYIFKKHNITRREYINSMHYYSFHLKEMKGIYNDVINRLSAIQVKRKKNTVDAN